MAMINGYTIVPRREMKLYTLDHSPYSTRVRAQIRHKGLPIEFVNPPQLRSEFIKSTFPNPKITGDELDEFIVQYYEKVKHLKHYGTTRRAISQQTNIPRTSVKRILDRLMKRKLVTVTKNDNLIVPTALARKKFSDYRKYLFTSFKRLNKIFNDSHLEYLNPNDPGL